MLGATGVTASAETMADIVAWPGYIERGETVKEFDCVTRRQDAWSGSRRPTRPMKWSPS